MILPGDRMRLVSEKNVVYISLLYATKHATVIFFEHQMDLGKGIQYIKIYTVCRYNGIYIL